MKLSISNIAWQSEFDTVVYALMRKYGYDGLEIAPTRVFPELPYEKNNEAKIWADKLKKTEGLVVSSMQSIWFGKQEKLFGTEEERRELVDYTKKAIDFAEDVSCRNLVFGCPRNRNIPKGEDSSVVIPFFREIGNYAFGHNTVIGMEANPPIYNTNYINDTTSAFKLIKQVNSKGFMLNLDVGTMIQNNEPLDELVGNVYLINHVHISEPKLKMIVQRELHKKLKRILEKEKYRGYVSIEMSKRDNFDEIEQALRYVGKIFE